MGLCGATELRRVTAGTTSPAPNRLAVRVTAATPMPATVPIPATVLARGGRGVFRAMALVPVPIMIPVTVLAGGCHGAFEAMSRATGDRDEDPAVS